MNGRREDACLPIIFRVGENHWVLLLTDFSLDNPRGASEGLVDGNRLVAQQYIDILFLMNEHRNEYART